MPPDDDAIASHLFALLDARSPDATICPSEVARAMVPRGDDTWRASMPAVRRVAARLQAEGRVVVTRGGARVDAEGGGPIRIGRPRER